MKRLALAAAALIASLGLIAPAAASGCERRHAPAAYGYGSGFAYRQSGPSFSFSYGVPAPVIIYRGRPGGYYAGPPHHGHGNWPYNYEGGRRFARSGPWDR